MLVSLYSILIMVCKELSNSEYNQHLNATKLLQTVNTESTLPCKIHSISCNQLIRIKQLFRLHLEQDQIIQNKIQHLWSWSNKLDKNKPHMVKLINTEIYIEIMDPKFYIHEHTTNRVFYKNYQNFLCKGTIYHN